MNMRIVGILIAAILFALIYLFNRQPVSLSGFEKWKNSAIGNNGIILSSNITFHNPNFLSATIQEINLNIAAGGVPVARFQHLPEQGIPGKKDSNFPITVRYETNDSTTVTESKITVTGFVTYRNFSRSDTILIQH